MSDTYNPAKDGLGEDIGDDVLRLLQWHIFWKEPIYPEDMAKIAFVIQGLREEVEELDYLNRQPDVPCYVD